MSQIQQVFKVFRETALPSRLEPYSIYLIAPTNTQDYFEMYVTNNDGTKARRQWGEAEVRTFVQQSLAAVGQLTVCNTIADRDRIQSPKQGAEVYVINASADPTVNRGGARYIRNNNQWIKTSETESMDLNLSWNALNGKPTSSSAHIDEAVNQRHQHANKTQLDLIGQDQQGNMTYNGQPIRTMWSSVVW